MRVLGLDYGSKTVGVAVSDPLGLTAQGVETVWRKQENKLRRTLARIEEIISEYQVTEIVLGYPKNMNNTVGERAEKSLEFKEMLERRTAERFLPAAHLSQACSAWRGSWWRVRCMRGQSPLNHFLSLQVSVMPVIF